MPTLTNLNCSVLEATSKEGEEELSFQIPSYVGCVSSDSQEPMEASAVGTREAREGIWC